MARTDHENRFVDADGCSPRSHPHVRCTHLWRTKHHDHHNQPLCAEAGSNDPVAENRVDRGHAVPAHLHLHSDSRSLQRGPNGSELHRRRWTRHRTYGDIHNRSHSDCGLLDQRCGTRSVLDEPNLRRSRQAGAVVLEKILGSGDTKPRRGTNTAMATAPRSEPLPAGARESALVTAPVTLTAALSAALLLVVRLLQ